MALIDNPGRKAWLRYALIYFGWVMWLWFTTSGNSDSFGQWIEQWGRWDAEWYSRIFRNGYGDDPRSLVFMPGFSFATAAVGSVFGLSFEGAAFALNVISYFVTSVIVSEFLAKRFKVPWWSILLVQLSNPVAFYALVPYSDALFSLFFWCAICFAVREPQTLSKNEKLSFAALLLLAPLIRITGFTLGIWSTLKRWFALIVLLPLALYLFMNFLKTGDAFYFLRAQKDFLMPDGWLLDGIRYNWFELNHPPGLREGGQMTLFWVQTSVFPLISTLLIAVSCAWLAKRRELVLLITMLAVAIFSRNQSYWRSVLRYDWPLMALIVLPWICWSSIGEEVNTLTRVRAYAARVFLFNLLFWGIIFQVGVARLLHVGIWAY
jgi:hypothetical protein